MDAIRERTFAHARPHGHVLASAGQCQSYRAAVQCGGGQQSLKLCRLGSLSLSPQFSSERSPITDKIQHHPTSSIYSFKAGVCCAPPPPPPQTHTHRLLLLLHVFLKASLELASWNRKILQWPEIAKNSLIREIFWCWLHLVENIFSYFVELDI